MQIDYIVKEVLLTLEFDLNVKEPALLSFLLYIPFNLQLLATLPLEKNYAEELLIP